MRNRHIKMVLIAYCILLIAAGAGLYLIPREGFMPGASEDDFQNALVLEDVMRNQIENMSEEELDKLYRISRWSFNYTGKSLAVQNPENEPVVFLRKDIDDGKVEVMRYLSPKVLEGVDFSSVIKPPHIDLSGSTLYVRHIKQKHTYTRFTKDFTMSQFYQADARATDYRLLRGHALIYVKVPKSVEY